MSDELSKRLAAMVFDPSRNVYFPDEPDRVMEHRLTTGEINEIIDALTRPSVSEEKIEEMAREIARAVSPRLRRNFDYVLTDVLCVLRKHLIGEVK